MSAKRKPGLSRMEWALLGFPILRPHRSALACVVEPLVARHAWAVEVVTTCGCSRLARDVRTGAVLVWAADERSHAAIHARIVGGRGGARVVSVLTMEPVRLPARRATTDEHGSARMKNRPAIGHKEHKKHKGAGRK